MGHCIRTYRFLIFFRWINDVGNENAFEEIFLCLKLLLQMLLFNSANVIKMYNIYGYFL